MIDLIVGADLAQSSSGDQHTDPELTRTNIARAIAIQIQAGNAEIDLDGLTSQGIPFHPHYRPHHLLHPLQTAQQQHQQPAIPDLPDDIHDTLRRKTLVIIIHPQRHGSRSSRRGQAKRQQGAAA